MGLSDTAIRSAKPRKRDYKMADGGGLYLLVTTTGGKLWRLKYRMDGVERKLSLGKYPAVPLADARKARDQARAGVERGEDPAASKRRKRVAAKLSAATTFDGVALEYIEKATREGRAPTTIAKLHWARKWLKSAIGHRPVDKIEPHEVLAVLKRQEKEGVLETARRTRAFASRVFRYAVATARAKSDPAGLLLGAVAAPSPEHLAAIVAPKRAGDLLRAIDGYSGAPVTRLALALSPHVFVRPGELPLLMFEIGWKAFWTLAYGLPLWLSDKMTEAHVQTAFEVGSIVIILPAIPWSYMWRQYVMRKGDRWTTQRTAGAER